MKPRDRFANPEAGKWNVAWNLMLTDLVVAIVLVVLRLLHVIHWKWRYALAPLDLILLLALALIVGGFVAVCIEPKWNGHRRDGMICS